MHPDLLHHVVCFVNNRGLRELLGYSRDRCITLRVPPCTLVPAHFTLLADLLRMRRRRAYAHVYYPEERVFVIVTRGYMMVRTGVTPNVVRGAGYWWIANDACSQIYTWDLIEPGAQEGQGPGRSAWVTADDYLVRMLPGPQGQGAGRSAWVTADDYFVK